MTLGDFLYMFRMFLAFGFWRGIWGVFWGVFGGSEGFCILCGGCMIRTLDASFSRIKDVHLWIGTSHVLYVQYWSARGIFISHPSKVFLAGCVVLEVIMFSRCCFVCLSYFHVGRFDAFLQTVKCLVHHGFWWLFTSSVFSISLCDMLVFMYLLMIR